MLKATATTRRYDTNIDNYSKNSCRIDNDIRNHSDGNSIINFINTGIRMPIATITKTSFPPLACTPGGGP